MEEIPGIFICGVVGLISLGVSFFCWQHVNQLLSESLPAEGEIIGFEEGHGDRITSAPRVKFTKREGCRSEFTNPVFSNPPGYKIGDRIRIFHTAAI